MVSSHVVRSVFTLLTLIAYIIMMIVNAFATPRRRPEFLADLYGSNLSTGDVSRMYSSKITPAGWAFSIWGVIYTWQALWIVYSLSLICRPQVPDVLNWFFHVLFILSCAFNCTWLIIWQRLHVTASSIILFASAFSLYGLLATSYYRFNKLCNANFPKIDFIAIQALVHNGIAFYATWCTVASLLNMTIAITYVHGVKAETAATITLAILAVEIIGWFIVENTVLEKYLRYTVSQYPVLIVALSAIISKHWDSSKRNPIIALVLLILETKASILSLIDPYADQFISKSRNIPVLTDLYKSSYLDVKFIELLQKCSEVQINISDEEIDIVEQDTRSQAKGAGFFRHRAGRIGASVCGAVFHGNLAQPSQSLIHSICYPHLFKINNKATKHGCKYEEQAIKTYEHHMKSLHTNFEIKRCGLFINKDFPFIHATPDFLVSCDCCGLGCGEVKCPISVTNGDFKEYSLKASSCLENVNGILKLKKSHNYYYQVQQQLFTLSDRKYCDFVVFAIDSDGNSHVLCDRINPDPGHSSTVMKKLEQFWRICILPEILGRWYTRRCDLPESKLNDNAVCFCRGQPNDDVVSCANTNCPYGQFHTKCLSLDNVTMPKQWYCPHCCKQPQFKKGAKGKGAQSQVNQGAMLKPTICICKEKPAMSDRLVECHNVHCSNGNFFHLKCLGLQRMPRNSKTTWLCYICRGTKDSTMPAATKPTSCTSSIPTSPATSDSSDADNDSDDEITITKVSTSSGSVNKYGILAKLNNSDYDIISDPAGWLTGDIIQCAQVLLKEVNPAIEGFQRPTLGRVRNFDIVSSEFIQILHTGGNHWVCVSSLGCQPGYVNLYDSLYSDVISQEVEDQTNDLMGGNLISLDFVPVQQQNNGSDCGVFSIAFATCLSFATNPSHFTFDIPRMRPHLLSCLKDRKISMFPSF